MNARANCFCFVFGSFALVVLLGLTGCTPEATSDKASEAELPKVVDLEIQTDPDEGNSVEDASTAGDSDSANKEKGATQLRILAWNVELDGGAKANVIAEQLKEFEDYDLIALSEIRPDVFKALKKATRHKGQLARSGNNIRLGMLWDDQKFEIEKFEELDELNDDRMRHRSPWVMLVKEKASKRAFYLVTVHLARGREKLRQRQAAGIRDWAREQSLPVIAIGDFNFDYVFADDKGNEAFNVFLQDGVMSWVKPAELIDTNWYDPESDGEDNYPGSMLDFAFVAGSAKDWSPRCRVIVREGDFPDDKQTSDHRPIELLLTPKY